MELNNTKNINEILTIEHIKSIAKFIQRIDLKPAEIDEFLNVLKTLQSLSIYYQNNTNNK
jgi:hypothetical protein